MAKVQRGFERTIRELEEEGLRKVSKEKPIQSWSWEVVGSHTLTR